MESTVDINLWVREAPEAWYNPNVKCLTLIVGQTNVEIYLPDDDTKRQEVVDELRDCFQQIGLNPNREFDTRDYLPDEREEDGQSTAS